MDKTPIRPQKRKRNDTSDSLDSIDSISSTASTTSTVLNTPEGSSEGMRTPPTLLLTPRGVNVATGQGSVIRKHQAYSEMLEKKQKYTLKLFNERLFDQNGNIEYDIRDAEKKLFHLVPATEEEIKQANNRELMLYDRNGEALKSNDLFNDMNTASSLTSGLTSKDGSGSLTSFTKNGGKKRKSRKKMSHKKTNKKKTNRKKNTRKVRL